MLSTEPSGHRELENTIVRLLKRRPFYGQFLLAVRREQRPGSFPLGITFRDGVLVLVVDPQRFDAESPAAREGLLEHCVKHVIHLHMVRRKGRNGHDWDVACDLAINPSIEHLPVDAPLPVHFSVDDGLAAEDYYNLLSNPFDAGSLEGQGAGRARKDEGGATGEGCDRDLNATTVDDHGAWEEADSTPFRLAEEVVRGMVREAWRQADGDVPADIRHVLEGMLAPSPIAWQQVLRQFVAAAGRIGREASWLKEHRRFAHMTPGIRKRRRLNLLVGIDVSESTDAVELREAFARELVRISRGRDAEITVLYANSRIQRMESFRGALGVTEVYHGGGFTDLRPVFEHARAMIPRPAAIIYLTDGAGPAPAHMEFPTLWVLTREGEKPVPWGAELRLEV